MKCWRHPLVLVPPTSPWQTLVILNVLNPQIKLGLRPSVLGANPVWVGFESVCLEVRSQDAPVTGDVVWALLAHGVAQLWLLALQP